MRDLREQLTETRRAARQLASLNRAQKDAAISAMAEALDTERAAILMANARDMQAAREKGLSPAMLDRLQLTDARIDEVIRGLREIVQLPDPVGEIRDEHTRPNGIRVAKMRVPLGVILMIYEARPNVTAEAAALCLKAGNAVVLRGGSEAFHSNQAIARVLQTALERHEISPAAITMLSTTEREALLELLRFDDLIDLVIPRGGEGLIRFVADHSRIPVIQHYKGVCHLYVDAEADLDKAVNLLIDGKTSRPGVCNALESLLVHETVAREFFRLAGPAMRARAVEIRGCEKTRAWLAEAKPVSDADFAAEFLALIISARVVPDMDAALEHIARFGSHHTEVIVTENAARAERFLREVDASAVMVNASSRFNDGGSLGLGAEIGIATTKLHAYGPMGLTSLTTEKFIVRGEGQTRHPVN